MSRIKPEKVWYHTYGNAKSAICPVCKINRMYRKSEDRTWEREHIMKIRNGGPDFIFNLIPICVECNSDNKPFESTYDFMVEIGTIDFETAQKKKRDHYAYMHSLCNNSRALVCIAQTGKNKQCKNNKVGDYCCMVHEKDSKFHLKRYLTGKFKKLDSITHYLETLSFMDEIEIR